MFKFLRKYNKWILAVGGTLLMIVFLVPQAIQGLSQQAASGGSVWATMNGEEVTGETRREYEKQIEILDALQRATPNLGITDEADHWFLLVKEAESAGLVGGLGSDQLPQDVMALYFNVASSVASPGLVDRAIGNRLAVDRLFRLYQSAAKISDGRLRREAEMTFHSADIRSVMIEAKARDEDETPPGAELLEQFEAFKDVAPGEGERGFGYMLPDRFKLEWLTVSRDAVRARVADTDGTDGVALIKHWQRNQIAKGFPTYEQGAEVPDVVREDFIDTRTAEQVDRIERFANDQLMTSRRRLETLDAYYVIPENWTDTQLGLGALATRIQEEFTGLELPSYEAIGDRWLELSELATLEGLAGASTDKYTGQPTPLTSLVAAAKELGADPALLVQQGIAGPPVRLPDQSIVVFRITDIEPARPPRDLDEVRDRVVTDVKRVRDYEALLARAETWLAQAKSEGLLAIAMNEDVELQRIDQVTPYNTFLLNFQLQNNLPITPQPSTLPIIGPNVETIDAIISNTLAMPDDRPLLEIPFAERTFLEAVDDKLTVMIYEIVGERSFTEDQYEQLVTAGALQRMLLNKELSEQDESIIDVFSREALSARHSFELKARQTTQPDEATAGVSP